MSINFRTYTESDLEIVREYVNSLYQEDPPGMKVDRSLDPAAGRALK